MSDLYNDLIKFQQLDIGIQAGQLTYYKVANHSKSFFKYATLYIQPKRNFFHKLMAEIKWIKSRNYNFYIRPETNPLLNVLVNGRRIDQAKKIKSDTYIDIGSFTFSIERGTEESRMQEPVIVAKGLEIKYPKKKEFAVHKLNLQIYRGEFVALMGPSGSGKSTILKELAGENIGGNGEIMIAGRELKQNYHSVLKKIIGHVPQDDIVHSYLTVREALFFCSRLKNIHPNRAGQLIEKILSILKISHKQNDYIKDLSGGERKRVSIAVELLDDPDVLLLDEPTSPLDPETVSEFLSAMRSLAKDYHKAIVMVTHKPDDLAFVDKVIFISSGGYPVYPGGKKDEFVSSVINMIGRRLDEPYILNIYKFFGGEEGKKNGKKFHQPGYADIYRVIKVVRVREKPTNFLYQLYWLTLRYTRIKFPSINKDKIGWKNSLWQFFMVPALVGILVCFVFPYFNLGTLFLMSLSAIWFGVSNASREIVGELPIYFRERMYNLNVDTYLISKIILLSLISVYQIAIVVGIIWFKFRYLQSVTDFIRGENTTEKFANIYLHNPLESGLFLLTLSIGAILLGLFLSTLFNTVEKVLIWVPLILMPQIMFSGIVSRFDDTKKEMVSYFMLGRWGLEGLAHIQDDKVKHLRADFTGGSAYRSYNSVVIEHPAPPPCDTLIYNTSAAIENLGTYNHKLRTDQKTFWTVFKSLDRNYLLLYIHIILMYFLCRFRLLKKDKISYYNPGKKSSSEVDFHFLLKCLLILCAVIGTYMYLDKSKSKRIIRECDEKNMQLSVRKKVPKVKKKKAAKKPAGKNTKAKKRTVLNSGTSGGKYNDESITRDSTNDSEGL